jgi:FKBP-type peptidyl-prolyl cis-trans isomerase
MSKMTWIFATIAAVGLTTSGCQPPPPIVTAAPPGIDLREETRSQEKTQDTGEALGEAVASSGEKPRAVVVPDIPPAEPTAKGEVKTTKAGVRYETLQEGTGEAAKAGQSVTVHYTGTLEDGRKFDSSRDRNEPATFSIGTGDVIRGWDEAVPGMKVGERRKMTVPPNAGYGAQGKPPAIPPNATLIFDIELINAK